MIPSKPVDQQIAELTDWRSKTMAKLRKIVHDSDSSLAPHLHQTLPEGSLSVE